MFSSLSSFPLLRCSLSSPPSSHRLLLFPWLSLLVGLASLLVLLGFCFSLLPLLALLWFPPFRFQVSVSPSFRSTGWPKWSTGCILRSTGCFLRSTGCLCFSSFSLSVISISALLLPLLCQWLSGKLRKNLLPHPLGPLLLSQPVPWLRFPLPPPKNMPDTVLSPLYHVSWTLLLLKVPIGCKIWIQSLCPQAWFLREQPCLLRVQPPVTLL